MPSAAHRVAVVDDDEVERWFTRRRENTAGPGAKALRTVEAPSDGSDCPICLDYSAAAGAGTGPAVWKEMPCRHRFHEACLEKWLIKDKDKASCPVCRRTLTPPPSELDDVHPQLRDIIGRNGKHLLGDNFHRWSARECATHRLYHKVVCVDQCLRLAGGLLAEALPQLSREMRLSDQGLRARIDLAEAKLTDARSALGAAWAAASQIAESVEPPVDGAVLRLLPARASLQAADDLRRTGHVHLTSADGWLSSGLPRHCVDAERLAAVADLEAALQEARAGVEVTSAALAGDSLRHIVLTFY